MYLPSLSATKPHEEYQYLDMLYKVARDGALKPNRTDNKTYSLFGNLMNFTLSKPDDEDPEKFQRILPLLTTKNMMAINPITNKMDTKGIFDELELFLKGQTNANILHEKGVKIWDANSSREYLDKYGFTERDVGDLGPVYGFQWRHWNAPYNDCHDNYTGMGIDQLQNAIKLLKRDPYNRRIIVSAWNPEQLNEMVLSPCHLLFQFNVEPSFSDQKEFETEKREMIPKYLDCAVYQRSADLPLGVPYNIASYATLTHIVSEIVGLQPRKLSLFTADTHIYENQLYFTAAQLFRSPYPFPTLEFTKKIDNIDQFTADLLVVKNYQSWGTISYPFSS